ncbi:MAG: ATP-binding protein [Rhodovibrionaceae bacterium]
MPIAPLSPDSLTFRCDPLSLGIDSSRDLQPRETLPGQERVLEAIEFGVEVGGQGFNLFVMGPEGSGKRPLLLRQLERQAAKEPTPEDWVYVHDFSDHFRPNAMRLPSGRGVQLSQAMQRFVEDVREAIPALFENEDNQNRFRSLEEEHRQKPDEAFETLREKAAEQDIALLRTPTGFGFAPLKDGEVIDPGEFDKLPAEEQARIKQEIETLQKDLQEVVKQLPRWDRDRRQALRELQSEIIALGVAAALEAAVEQFQDLPEVLAYLEAVKRDLIANYHAIRMAEQAAAQKQEPGGSEASFEIGGFERYKVNALVTHESERGAPVVIEDNPTVLNLIGRAEHISRFGALVTDFSLIKPGALHRANGGYLVIEARKLLTQPFSWDALKRALKAREIRIESPAQSMSLISTASLEPEPIPLDTKVVLLGERRLFYLLSELDPEFEDLFKVAADFDEEIDRDADHQREFLRVIAGQIVAEELKPFDACALTEVLRHSVRLAGDRRKLSLHARSLNDLLREADYLAGKAGVEMVGEAQVRQAVAAQIRRVDRIREKSHEAIEREIVRISTSGVEVGQINGLSVLQFGGFAFGRPSRITARVHVGAGKVMDIEREVKLGGPLHSKGVLILSGFLAGRYALERPLSLSATLVFEQSYGGVDGDSASSAELYALFSALSEVPLRQDLAVTGSVDQFGQVQAIGGVNEKIEGFFDICRARGLTGTQGAMIPAANVEHLMLREDVIEAVARGDFAVYAVDHVDQGIELLTGRSAGERDAEGRFPADSINALVDARLVAFAKARQAFAEPDGKAAGA